MTPDQFVYWMQGFVELGSEHPTAAQWKSICEHLATVFHKVTPPVEAGPTSSVTVKDPMDGKALDDLIKRMREEMRRNDFRPICDGTGRTVTIY